MDPTITLGNLLSMVAVVVAALALLMQQQSMHRKNIEKITELSTKVDLIWRLITVRLKNGENAT